MIQMKYFIFHACYVDCAVCVEIGSANVICNGDRARKYREVNDRKSVDDGRYEMVAQIGEWKDDLSLELWLIWNLSNNEIDESQLPHDCKNVLCAQWKWDLANFVVLTAFIWLCFYHACDNYIVRVDIVIVNLSAVVTASSFLLHLAFHAANSLPLLRLLGCVNKLSRLREHAW